MIPMALALVVAAFLGASLGLVWQSSGFGRDSADDEEVLTGDGSSAEAGAAAADEEADDADEDVSESD